MIVTDTPIDIRTVVKFETAHRQFEDPSKCGKLHGHNWKAEVIITGNPGDLGYIVDFKDMKSEIYYFDHSVILNEDDPLALLLTNAGEKVRTIGGNPTCELLAIELANRILNLSSSIDVVQLTLWENDESYAEVIV